MSSDFLHNKIAHILLIPRCAIIAYIEMAGQQGAPFYTALIWPLPHLKAALMTSESDLPGIMVSAPLGPMGHLSAVMSCTRNISIAWICMFILPQLMSPGRELKWSQLLHN